MRKLSEITTQLDDQLARIGAFHEGTFREFMVASQLRVIELLERQQEDRLDIIEERGTQARKRR